MSLDQKRLIAQSFNNPTLSNSSSNNNSNNNYSNNNSNSDKDNNSDDCSCERVSYDVVDGTYSNNNNTSDSKCDKDNTVSVIEKMLCEIYDKVKQNKQRQLRVLASSTDTAGADNTIDSNRSSFMDADEGELFIQRQLQLYEEIKSSYRTTVKV